jgi:hypothetical protein
MFYELMFVRCDTTTLMALGDRSAELQHTDVPLSDLGQTGPTVVRTKHFFRV